MEWFLELVDITLTHLINFILVPLSFEVYGISALDLLGFGAIIVVVIWILKLIRG